MEAPTGVELGATPVIVRECPKFLGLLDMFYEDRAEPLALRAELVDPDDVPQPYRRLLVHRNDMTPTLEEYCGERIVLRVLHRIAGRETLCRHVVLEGARSKRALEYGAIRISLPALGEEARRRVIECRVPLGRILREHGIAHRSCPGGFFKVQASPAMVRALRLDDACWLYGRCNCLSAEGGPVIAEVVEILPQFSGE
jgi:chorismate-pyruvate lyase